MGDERPLERADDTYENEGRFYDAPPKPSIKEVGVKGTLFGAEGLRSVAQFQGTPGRETPGRDHKQAESWDPAKLSGKTFGKFKIGEAIGRGGEAIIYAAYNVETHVWVALKIMRIEGEKEDVALRRRGFLREISALARVEHTHIVPIQDFGVLDPENPNSLFVVTPLYEGGSLSRLSQIFQRGSVKETTLLFKIMIPIVQALEAIWQNAHMAHLDVKPENILLDMKAQKVNPMLADFGQAKVITTRASRAPSAIVCSPDIAAPEQLDDKKPKGPWTDIWAVGVTLFKMLTGKSPLPVENIHYLGEENDSPNEQFSTRMFMALRDCTEGKANIVDIRTLRNEKDVPPEAASIIMRCLSLHEAVRLMAEKGGISKALEEVVRLLEGNARASPRKHRSAKAKIVADKKQAPQEAAA